MRGVCVLLIRHCTGTNVSHIIRHVLVTVCLVLGRPATDRPWKIVRHFTVRDAVRPLRYLSFSCPSYSSTCIY